MSSVSIKDFTRRQPKGWAGLPFTKVAEAVLPGWDISLVFVGEARARALNQKLRGKDYIPNVLSYRTGAAVPGEALAKSGEIIICPSEAAKQAPAYRLSAPDFLLLLFIHGVLHIKGWAHGARMEACERKLLATLGRGAVRSLPNVTTHSNRHRYRHVPGKSGRRRGTLR